MLYITYPRRSLYRYVGGMAELFLTSEEEEQLYLMKRKGFIKLALQEGVDIVPSYMFGNTTVLSVLKTGLLADISRKVFFSCVPAASRQFADSMFCFPL